MPLIKANRMKPEQTQETLEQTCPGRGKEILSKIDEFKKINQLDSLLQKLSSFGAEGDRRAQDWRI